MIGLLLIAVAGLAWLASAAMIRDREWAVVHVLFTLMVFFPLLRWFSNEGARFLRTPLDLTGCLLILVGLSFGVRRIPQLPVRVLFTSVLLALHTALIGVVIAAAVVSAAG